MSEHEPFGESSPITRASLALLVVAITATAATGCRDKGAPLAEEKPNAPTHDAAGVMQRSPQAATILAMLREALCRASFGQPRRMVWPMRNRLSLLPIAHTETFDLVAGGLHPRFAETTEEASARLVLPSRASLPFATGGSRDWHVGRGLASRCPRGRSPQCGRLPGLSALPTPVARPSCTAQHRAEPRIF